MKTFRSVRGFAIVVILPYLAGAAVVAYGYHQYQVLLSPGRNKAKVSQAAGAANDTAQQAAAVDVTAAAVKAAVDAAHAAHLEVIKTRDAIDAGVAGRLETVKAILATDKEPTAAEVAAQIMLQDAQDALGHPLTDAERAYWTKLAVPLIEKQQSALAEAQRQREVAAQAIAARDAVQADSARKDGLLKEQATTIKEQSGQLLASATKSATLAADVKAWADREPDMLARLKALGMLVAMLVIGIVVYEIRRRGLTGALHDAVALKEHVEATAVSLGADAAKLKESATTWWHDDPNARHAFDKVKAKLRI